jgi:hypothetical protein
VGRHNAGDGAAVHPIIAAALEGRMTVPAAVEPQHTPAVAAEPEEGPLGWPGEPGDGTGLGWPAAPRPASSATPAAGTVAEPPRRRRGWRRLFGSAAA